MKTNTEIVLKFGTSSATAGSPARNQVYRLNDFGLEPCSASHFSVTGIRSSVTICSERAVVAYNTHLYDALCNPAFSTRTRKLLQGGTYVLVDVFCKFLVCVRALDLSKDSPIVIEVNCLSEQMEDFKSVILSASQSIEGTVQGLCTEEAYNTFKKENNGYFVWGNKVKMPPEWSVSNAPKGRGSFGDLMRVIEEPNGLIQSGWTDIKDGPNVFLNKEHKALWESTEDEEGHDSPDVDAEGSLVAAINEIPLGSLTLKGKTDPGLTLGMFARGMNIPVTYLDCESGFDQEAVDKLHESLRRSVKISEPSEVEKLANESSKEEYGLQFLIDEMESEFSELMHGVSESKRDLAETYPDQFDAEEFKRRIYTALTEAVSQYRSELEAQKTGDTKVWVILHNELINAAKAAELPHCLTPRTFQECNYDEQRLRDSLVRLLRALQKEAAMSYCRGKLIVPIMLRLTHVIECLDVVLEQRED